MVSRIHCCNQKEVCYILRLLELEMLFKNHLIEGYRNHMWLISVALHTIRNLTNPKKFLGFRPKVHESSDPVQAIPAIPPWPWMPGIHFSMRLWAAVCCSWSALEKSTRWQNSVCQKWPFSKDLLRKPLHNLASQVVVFWSTKKWTNFQLFHNSHRYTTHVEWATNVPGNASMPDTRPHEHWWPRFYRCIHHLSIVRNNSYDFCFFPSHFSENDILLLASLASTTRAASIIAGGLGWKKSTLAECNRRKRKQNPPFIRNNEKLLQLVCITVVLHFIVGLLFNTCPGP